MGRRFLLFQDSGVLNQCSEYAAKRINPSRIMLDSALENSLRGRGFPCHALVTRQSGEGFGGDSLAPDSVAEDQTSWSGSSELRYRSFRCCRRWCSAFCNLRIKRDVCGIDFGEHWVFRNEWFRLQDNWRQQGYWFSINDDLTHRPNSFGRRLRPGRHVVFVVRREVQFCGFSQIIKARDATPSPQRLLLNLC